MQRDQPFVDVDQSHRLEDAELPQFISRQVLAARRYYFDLNPKTKNAIKVNLGGSERLRNDYANRRSIFPYFSIEFVAEGKGMLTLRGRNYDLKPGTIFGCTPNSSLEIRPHSADLMLKYYVTFVGREAKNWLKTLGFLPAGVSQIANVGEIREIFDLMIRYGLSQTRFSQALCDSLVPTLIYKIAEQVIQHPREDNRALATYQQFKDLLEGQFIDIKNIHEAAQRCDISVPYACNLFRRFDHQSPYQFLLRQKMNYAADLLSDPEKQIKKVAQQLGFADPFHFSRLFKRILGLSPSDFQRHFVTKK